MRATEGVLKGAREFIERVAIERRSGNVREWRFFGSSHTRLNLTAASPKLIQVWHTWGELTGITARRGQCNRNDESMPGHVGGILSRYTRVGLGYISEVSSEEGRVEY